MAETLKLEQHLMEVGDTIVIPQDFNATCGTIERITDDEIAVLTDAHDIFGPLNKKVGVRLAHAKPFPGRPRRLSLYEAVSV